MTVEEFREFALSFPGAEAGTHMGCVDFRVGGRVFATLAMQGLGFGNLMLTPELQRTLIVQAPDIFLPVKGGWGRMGATHIRLASASETQLKEALTLAWNLRVEKNKKARSTPKAPKKRSQGKSC